LGLIVVCDIAEAAFNLLGVPSALNIAQQDNVPFAQFL